MNKNQLKVIVAKYAAIKVTRGELEDIIKTDNPKLSDEEIAAVITGIFEPGAEMPDEEKQQTIAAPLTVAELPKGKKKYDILKGQWVAREQMQVPGTNQILVTKWEFQPEGKAIVTGVPMEEEKVIEFNRSRCIRAGKLFTEQMRESGSDELLFDNVDNPYQIHTV